MTSQPLLLYYIYLKKSNFAQKDLTFCKLIRDAPAELHSAQSCLPYRLCVRLSPPPSLPPPSSASH